MDISLFSEMIKNLILDNDEVTLPGVGSFVSEVVPSSFSDKGYTINPPYRKLSFRHRQGKDNLLAEFYSKSNGTDLESAEKLVKVFLDGLEEDLRTKKTVEMPGLGRLRATREGTIFFIPDEDLDIYCSGFGLQPVSLKTHEETPEEVARAVSDLRKMVDDPVPPLKPLPETGQEEWQNVAEKMASNIDTYWKPFAAFDKTTISESDARVRCFLNGSFESTRNGNQISIQTRDFTGDAYFLLRTHGEKPEKMAGGTWKTVEADTYLLRLTSELASVTLVPETETYYKY